MSVCPKFISAAEVEKLLDREELLTALENAFGNFSQGVDGGVVQPVRSVIDVTPHKGLLLVMPGYSQHDNALATKIVAVYPENKEFSTHQGQVLLFNPENGNLQAIIDGDSLTASRTAAASAVATKHLANPNSKTLAILGAGVQARSHFKVLSLLHKFDEVRVWSRTRCSAQKFAQEIGGRACATAEECVHDADIICTVTFSTTPVLQKEWVKEGAHINAVGACRADWHEIDPALMRSGVVYVDSREGCDKESGDILLAKAEVFGEIGEVIIGRKEALWQKTTIFKSVGMALEDVVSAKLVYEKYVATSSGNIGWPKQFWEK